MNEFDDIFDEYDPANDWVLYGNKTIESENDMYWKKQPEKFNDDNYDTWKTRNKQYKK
jgi:hypothetical protein